TVVSQKRVQSYCHFYYRANIFSSFSQLFSSYYVNHPILPTFTSTLNFVRIYQEKISAEIWAKMATNIRRQALLSRH
ncbi:MAG: hypothetical protein K2J74_04590, partial [Muribaculaceae bacterium]|nr:hypothetical protein [Muribaculaceae bacterium]